ncbi:MAG TPA: FAD-dependent oxidoreductase [Thermosynergistes sp.]|nr:FAD-dependent oxidoreductase [Thermosynergistes sp.]
MRDRFDVVVVGAGPAGIFAARELVKSGLDVAVIDKGKPLGERLCPLKAGMTSSCAHCNPCGVLSGWGGAGAFSDGKLTLTPEFGGNLERYVGRERLCALIEEVDAAYMRYGDDTPLYEPDPSFAAEVVKKGRGAGLQVIPAKIRHVGTDKSSFILRGFYDELKSKAAMFMETEVTGVIAEGGSVKGVTLGDGSLIAAQAVILAPGRVGAPWVERLAKDLGLPVDSIPVDVGLRLEMPAEWSEAITQQFYEVKVLFDAPTFDDKVRTFCMCPHGEVVTEYQSEWDVVTVNGHSYRDHKTDNTNFAILVSTEFTEPFRDPNGYGAHIARLANMLGGGALIQRLGDLKAGRRSTRSRIERGLTRPTLKDAEPGDISFALPYRHLKDILEMVSALDAIMPGIDGPHTLLYGVEVKFYSLRLSVNGDLQTPIRGLYAAGDGAGITRGLIQSSASGIVAARAITQAMKAKGLS